jgi:hypothetical protein
MCQPRMTRCNQAAGRLLWDLKVQQAKYLKVQQAKYLKAQQAKYLMQQVT